MRSPSYHILLVFTTGFTAPAFSQFTDAFVIDASEWSTGVTSMAVADLDLDGLPDVVTANGYNVGRITTYTTAGGPLHAAQRTVVDTNAPFAEGVDVADMDQDGRVDIVAVTRYEGEVILYRNEQGAFPERIVVDSALITLNGVRAGDVDGDGFPDLVVIGQHSIDLYRNNGQAGFTKEPILTTATSPWPLECMDLVLVDIDGDGDLDPITAETVGPVIYRNDGTGTFTPERVDLQPAIQAQIQVGDLDGDGDPDIVVVSFLGTARWYRNDAGSWADAGALWTGHGTVRNFALCDVDMDGRTDALIVRENQLWYQQSLGSGSFGEPVLIFTNGNSIMDELVCGDLDHDGRPDVAWSAPASTVAYHLNELPLAVRSPTATTPFRLHTDTGSGSVVVRFDHVRSERFILLDATGRVVRRYGPVHTGDRIDLEGLATGTYILQAATGGALAVVRY